jgi:beta-galactosidase
VGVGPCLDESLQWKLLDYVRQGGRLFLHGLVPVKDMTGQPCRVLLEGLGLKAGPVRDSNDKFYPTLVPSGFLDRLPEIRVWRVQTVSGGSPVYQLAGGMGDCAVEASSGQGRALVFSFEHPSQQRVFSRISQWLGVKPRLAFGAEDTGVVGTFASRGGEKVVLAMNLDREAKEVRPTVDGWTFPRDFILGGREARLLPLGVSFGPIQVEWSTMEALSWDGEVLVFRDAPAGGRVKASGAAAVLGRESASGVFDAVGGRLALRVRP